MQGKNVRVPSSEGGEFDCYRVTPRGAAKVPTIVLASAVHGVNEDLRAIADEFASHGYIRELEGLARPVCIIWGDADHQAPAEVLDAYRGAAARMKNLELHIFPGVLHGYMMPDNAKAFDRRTREFSMARALAILEGLRGGEAGRRKAG